MKIKILYARSSLELEREVNKFLEDFQENKSLIDMKFTTEKFVDDENISYFFNCLILYEELEQ